MDGLDDFGVVDGLQVDGGGAEVAVAELALSDDERHAFASHFGGVRVPELVGREAPADTVLGPSGVSRLARRRLTTVGRVSDR